MNKQDILTLFDYNYWASARIWKALLQVTPEQFTAKNTSSYGSLRGTLVHTLLAEVIWRRRIQGEPQPVGFPLEADFPTPQSLVAFCQADEQVQRAFLSGLSEEFLQSTLEYKNTKGVPFQNVVWNILAHVVNHGTQHRAEAAAMLTDFGHSPGDVDMILYFREKNG